MADLRNGGPKSFSPLPSVPFFSFLFPPFLPLSMSFHASKWPLKSSFWYMYRLSVLSHTRVKNLQTVRFLVHPVHFNVTLDNMRRPLMSTVWMCDTQAVAWYRNTTSLRIMTTLLCRTMHLLCLTNVNNTIMHRARYPNSHPNSWSLSLHKFFIAPAQNSCIPPPPPQSSQQVILHFYA